MNLKKYNFYKNSLWSYIALGLILIAGLVVGLVLGMNASIDLSGSIYLKSVLSVLVFSVCAFIYTIIRHEVYMAITMVLSIMINSMLTVALITLIRVPVNDSITMCLMIVSALTVINNLMIFSEVKDEHKKPASKEEMVNSMIEHNFKNLLLVNSLILIATCFLLFIFNAEILEIGRMLLVGIVATFFVSVFCTVPFWGFFVKEKKKKKVDTNREVDYVK